jgi:hypothetical protein
MPPAADPGALPEKSAPVHGLEQNNSQGFPMTLPARQLSDTKEQSFANAFRSIATHG